MQLNSISENKEIILTDDEPKPKSRLGQLNDYSNIIIEETERSSERGRLKSNTNLQVYTDKHQMTFDDKRL